jgi:hypothetical protein
MSFITSLSNKISYMVNTAVSDPNADAYAAAKAKQAQHDAEVAKNKAATAADAAAQAKAEEDAKAEAAKLSARSKASLSGFAGKSAKGILQAFIILACIAVAMYGGHIAANHDIGYSPAGRLVSFFYGCILSPFIICKYIWNIFYDKMEIPMWGFLPLSTYVPNGDLEVFFLGPFCYKEDQGSIDARARVAQSYLEAFQRTAPLATPPKVTASKSAV